MSLYPQTPYPRLGPIPTWQFVGHGSAIDFSMGCNQSSATEQIDFQSTTQTSLQAFITNILGYSKSAGTLIYRQVPAQHAILPYMYASRITRIEGIGANGKTTGLAGPFASYKLLRATIAYETPPYKIAANKQGLPPTGNEYDRYVIPQFESSTEFLQTKRGSFQWPAASLQGAVNSSIPEAFGQAITICKDRYSFNWIQVPDVGLFPNGFDQSKVSTNIQNGIGKVNNASFMGFDKHTLLFESWKPTARTEPIFPSWLGLNPGDVPRTWDVLINFVHFDPKPLGSTSGGFNALPNPDGNWYRVYRTGSPTFPTTDTAPFWIYQEYDFTKIFQMN